MTINDRITLIRKFYKLNQEEFANVLVDYSQANISDIERGKVKVDVVIMEKLYNKYGISPIWLITGNGEMIKLNLLDSRLKINQNR